MLILRTLRNKIILLITQGGREKISKFEAYMEREFSEVFKSLLTSFIAQILTSKINIIKSFIFYLKL